MKSHKRGFTLLELQIAVLLLAFGIVTLASLMVTQTRLHKKLQIGFKPGDVVSMRKSADPWVRQLDVPARLSTDPITQADLTPIP